MDCDTLRSALAPLVLPGEELVELVHALSRPPARAVRLSGSYRAEQLPFETEIVPWHGNARIVTQSCRPGSQLEFATGRYYVQDAASLLAVTLLDTQPGERVCDLCASPGGKAIAILEQLAQGGFLLANETVRSRVGPLRFNLARFGCTRFAVSNLDPDRLAASLANGFNAVLVDAPCTGQALLGKGKASATALNPNHIDHCERRQARILGAARQLVRPGGRLVYSTCTFAYQENEQQVERLLKKPQPDGSLWHADPLDDLKRWESPVLPGCYRLWPHRHNCQGAFAARLRRDEQEEAGPARKHSGSSSILEYLQARRLQELSEWGQLQYAQMAFSDQLCFAWPEPLWSKLLSVAQWGPEVAFRKGKTWFPSYALAMRRGPLWQPRCTIELDRDEAVRYVVGHSPNVSLHGWAVASWQHQPLGWLKGHGFSPKNHLPKQGRLKQVAE